MERWGRAILTGVLISLAAAACTGTKAAPKATQPSKSSSPSKAVVIPIIESGTDATSTWPPPREEIDPSAYEAYDEYVELQAAYDEAMAAQETHLAKNKTLQKKAKALYKLYRKGTVSYSAYINTYGRALDEYDLYLDAYKDAERLREKVNDAESALYEALEATSAPTAPSASASPANA